MPTPWIWVLVYRIDSGEITGITLHPDRQSALITAQDWADEWSAQADEDLATWTTPTGWQCSMSRHVLGQHLTPTPAAV